MTATSTTAGAPVFSVVRAVRAALQGCFSQMPKHVFTATLLGMASALAASAAMADGDAADATTAPATQSQGPGLEEIIVTAEKREQSQQVVPVSIEALSGDQLQQQVVLNVQDLRSTSPDWWCRRIPRAMRRPSRSDLRSRTTAPPAASRCTSTTCRWSATTPWRMRIMTCLGRRAQGAAGHALRQELHRRRDRVPRQQANRPA